MKDYFDLVIDSSTRDRSATNANTFTSYLSTPIYGVESLSLVSCSIPYINGSQPSVGIDVHAYYLVVEIPNYGIVTDDLYCVRNPPDSGSNNVNFAYTGSLIVPQIDGSTPTNYIVSGVDQEINLNKKIPVMNSIKISIYYFNTGTGKYELYPFDETFGTVEEYVIKFSIRGTKDKRESVKVKEVKKPPPPPVIDASSLEPLFKKYLEPLETRKHEHHGFRNRMYVLLALLGFFGIYYMFFMKEKSSE